MAGHSRPKDGVASLAYVPAIHVFVSSRLLDVDARDKRGHDESVLSTILPRCCGGRIFHAAFRSRSAFHWPSEASPFIMARWLKARCAAATFSGLPDHAFCGAACKARP